MYTVFPLIKRYDAKSGFMFLNFILIKLSFMHELVMNTDAISSLRKLTHLTLKRGRKFNLLRGNMAHVLRSSRKSTSICKTKCKLMIIVVNALSYPWYCLTTDQLFHRRATQTNETNIINET